jgi:hypothetical protein
VVFSLGVAADLAAERLQTAVGGVACLAAFQRQDARLPDLPGGGKVGFTDTKRDHILHRFGNIKVLSNAGGLDLDNLFG